MPKYTFMKKQLCQILAINALAIFSVLNLYAQCNVNERYDKLISGYHSSIALKSDGVYCVWGSGMQNTGLATGADQLSPQDINVTNYPNLTGTVLKAALGGKNAGAAVDQGIILTTTGLFAWGIAGNVLKSTYTTSNTFARTTYITGAANSYGLPVGVTPTDVQIMFASYQTLVIVTKIVAGVGGDVWILTQASTQINGNNGGTLVNIWSKVLKSATAGDYLTNVTALRGQVSNATYNAFMAQTLAGAVYTWGNSTYLGNAATFSARAFATLMTLPTESGSAIIPKMIAVTGGIGTTTTTTNTYYILSTTGNLYALGHNSQRQCGTFDGVTPATEKINWVQVKKDNIGNFLTNVTFISCQEHNCSYPGIAAVTANGELYTWGNNSSGMLARSNDQTVGGLLTTVTTVDPGLTAGVSGIVISSELGGHTMIYLKTGSSQFCYAGHQVQGSMGDGTTTGAGTSAATTLILNCASTPVLAICGSVPTSASTTNSTISCSSPSIAANGTTTSTITVRLYSAANAPLTTSGGIVIITTDLGTLGTVVDNNDGTYTCILTSSVTTGTATLGFSINGVTATGPNSTTTVAFVPLPLKWIQIQAFRQSKLVKINWTTSSEMNVKSFDVERSLNGSDWQVIIANIAANNGINNNDYQQTDTAYNPNRLFYRVRQKDIDGRFTYSYVQTVANIADINTITIFPVPAENNFHLGNVNPSAVKQVQLFNASGALIKTWNKLEASFDLQGIPAGVYMIQINLNNQEKQILKLYKK